MRTALLALTLLLGPLAQGATAQEAEEPASFVINLRDADIRTLAEQVSEITGRTLVLDPAVEGEVTVISSQPLDEAGVWELFLSVLRVQGFAALRSGSTWRVIPEDQVREGGGGLEDPFATGRLDVVTRLVQLRNFPATTAATALRPLVAAFGYIEALPETNALVVTDVAENVARIQEIARQLDEGNGDQLGTIFVRNADAAELAAGIQEVFGGAEGGTAPADRGRSAQQTRCSCAAAPNRSPRCGGSPRTSTCPAGRAPRSCPSRGSTACSSPTPPRWLRS